MLNSGILSRNGCATNFSGITHMIILNAADESRIRCILYDRSDDYGKKPVRNGGTANAAMNGKPP